MRQLIIHNEKQLALTRNAYLDYDTQRGAYYTALVQDSEGNEYRVIWLVSDSALMLDADECCDWSTPDAIDELNCGDFGEWS